MKKLIIIYIFQISKLNEKVLKDYLILLNNKNK